MDLAPRTPQELVDIIAAAAADGVPLGLFGQGTKRDWGRSVSFARQVTLRGFSGIVDYAPAELVLTAGAGTPLAEIEQALAAEGQHLAFEPPDLGPLFGRGANQATIGGVLATNLSGSRRPFAGAARDFFLGFSGVNGRGEVVKAGGKVVKNVTGYDLPKLIAGSFGTLIALTEITIKVVPAPETSCSAVLDAVAPDMANACMTQALGSTADPSGAAYLPDRQLVFRLEGSGPSVAYRLQVLTDLLRRDMRVLAEAPSRELWREIRDLKPLKVQDDEIAWLLSAPPVAFSGDICKLAEQLPGLRFLVDWGGGRIWLTHGLTALDPAMRAVHSLLRQGGHATLVKAPADWRQSDLVFSPDVPVALLQKVRAAFDPMRLFNRGRLHTDL